MAVSPDRRLRFIQSNSHSGFVLKPGNNKAGNGFGPVDPQFGHDNSSLGLGTVIHLLPAKPANQAKDMWQSLSRHRKQRLVIVTIDKAFKDLESNSLHIGVAAPLMILCIRTKLAERHIILSSSFSLIWTLERH